MFLLFYSIWGDGEEDHGIPAQRLSANLWLHEMENATARAWFGMPSGSDHRGSCVPQFSLFIYNWK